MQEKIFLAVIFVIALGYIIYKIYPRKGGGGCGCGSCGCTDSKTTQSKEEKGV